MPWKCKNTRGMVEKGTVEDEVGGWVRLLTVREHHLLMAGKIPVKAQKLMRWKGTQRQNETREQAIMRLQAVMVKFGAAMVEVRRARGDLGLGEVGGRGDVPQCAECGRDDVYIPCGDAEKGGPRQCQACHQKLMRMADGEQCMMCGGDTEGGGVCRACLQEADITLRTMVSVRDKVVDAYQQIMNMQI